MKKVNRVKSEGPNEVDVLVGQKLRELRMLAGLSQSDLAATIGLTFQQLQKYERGVNRISASKLYLLACQLSVPVSTFFADMEGQGGGHRGVRNGAERQSSAEGETSIRSREALILARNFQRIRDPHTKAALRAFFDACAGIEASPAPVSERSDMIAEPAMPPSAPRKVADGAASAPRKRQRRPRGAVWHPVDIERA